MGSGVGDYNIDGFDVGGVVEEIDEIVVGYLGGDIKGVD